MHEDYKLQALTFIEQALSSSLDNNVDYQTMIMLRDKLHEKGFDLNDAERVVSLLHIQIDPELFVDDDFMLNLITMYSDLIIDIHQYTITKFVNTDVFFNYIRNLSIVFNP